MSLLALVRKAFQTFVGANQFSESFAYNASVIASQFCQDSARLFIQIDLAMHHDVSRKMMAAMNRAKKKEATKPHQEAIDRLVVSQANDESAWEFEVRVKTV